jgi:hypothetical protein
MQIRQVPEIVESLAVLLHTVWQSWLASVLEHGGVPPETRVVISATTVNRWRKLASVSYDSLTHIEKDPYRHLASELEDALARDYIIIKKADYDSKIQAEVIVEVATIYPDLLDCLVYARGEALAKNAAIVQKSTRVLAFFSQMTNKGQKVAVLNPNKRSAIKNTPNKKEAI